jgi:hypothetical protein
MKPGGGWGGGEHNGSHKQQSKNIKQNGANVVLRAIPYALMLNIITPNEIKAIQRPNRKNKIYAYVDDMVMVSRLIKDLQQTFNLAQCK